MLVFLVASQDWSQGFELCVLISKMREVGIASCLLSLLNCDFCLTIALRVCWRTCDVSEFPPTAEFSELFFGVLGAIMT